MARSFRLLSITVLLLGLLPLAACSAASPIRDNIAPAPMATSAPAAPMASYSSEASKSTAAGAAAPRPAAAPAAPAAAGGSGTSTGSNNPAGERAALQLDRRIIKNGTLSVTVKDVGPIVDQASDLTATKGGWVASSQIAQVAEGKNSATLTLKVPVDRYDELMKDLRGLGKVTAERTTSQDVTDEYEDLNAQIANLKILETRYQELLSRASTTADILAITQKLSEVRGQIDRAQGRVNSLTRRTDYSEISLSLIPDGVAVSNPGWQPSTELAAAFKALLALLQGLATLAIWIVIAGSPFLIIIAVVIFLWRRRRRRPALPAAPSGPPAPAATGAG